MLTIKQEVCIILGTLLLSVPVGYTVAYIKMFFM